MTDYVLCQQMKVSNFVPFLHTYLFIFMLLALWRCNADVLLSHYTFYMYTYMLKYFGTYLQTICYLFHLFICIFVCNCQYKLAYSCQLRAFAALCILRAVRRQHSSAHPLSLFPTVNRWRGCRKWSSRYLSPVT